MTAYPFPRNDADRLRFLRSLRLDFSAPIPELQKLAEGASTLADAPIALVSLVDEEIQTFAANVGLPGVDGTGRDLSFCARAIMESGQLVVPDAEADPRFRDNPLVRGAPEIRAYAGSVLEPEAGIRLATLCVIDTKPRHFSPDVLAQLDRLSDAATALLLACRDRLTLRDWRIDVRKLDATFVGGIGENARDEAIVHSMVDLAHRLGLQVAAEGIETGSVARKIREMGCAQGQGFLFSPAVEDPMALCLRDYAACWAPGRKASA